jgi:hypothetical protein
MDKGNKYDSKKIQLHLVPYSYIRGTAKVFMYGANKYGKWNWKKGLEYSRLIDAALRHIYAFQEGHNNDAETRLSHLYHASCNLAMLSVLLTIYKEGDDRNVVKTKKKMCSIKKGYSKNYRWKDPFTGRTVVYAR